MKKKAPKKKTRKKTTKRAPKAAAKTWEPKDETRLRQLFAAGKSDAQIGRSMGRTAGAILNRRARLGLGVKKREAKPAVSPGARVRRGRRRGKRHAASARAAEALRGVVADMAPKDATDEIRKVLDAIDLVDGAA